MAEENTAKKKKKPRKKKTKFSTGFIITLVLVVGLPVGGLLVWYFTTAALTVTGSKFSASEMVAANLAKVQVAMKDIVKERAREEGFSVEDVDSCREVEKQYTMAQGVLVTKFTERQLLGLPMSAGMEDILERCILFAKIVGRMERLAHHDRHVFMCEGAEFTADESGRFRILPDIQGRGLIESLSGQERLIKIPRGSHKLIRHWQVFNIGDGCVVIGMSKIGVFWKKVIIY